MYLQHYCKKGRSPVEICPYFIVTNSFITSRAISRLSRWCACTTDLSISTDSRTIPYRAIIHATISHLGIFQKKSSIQHSICLLWGFCGEENRDICTAHCKALCRGGSFLFFSLAMIKQTLGNLAVGNIGLSSSPQGKVDVQNTEHFIDLTAKERSGHTE